MRKLSKYLNSFFTGTCSIKYLAYIVKFDISSFKSITTVNFLKLDAFKKKVDIQIHLNKKMVYFKFLIRLLILKQDFSKSYYSVHVSLHSF